MLQYKNVSKGTLDVDDISRRVKVAISHVESQDSDSDVIDSGAYEKTIKERGPKGAGLIYHLVDHMPKTSHMIARFKELAMEGQHLVGVTEFPNTTLANDMLELYKTGNIVQHSVGFQSVRQKMEGKGEDSYNRILEIKLFEGSAVLHGANPNTPTISVGKSATKEEIEIEEKALTEEMDAIFKALHSSKISDEMGVLLEIREKQLIDRVQTIFAIKSTHAAAVAAPAPEKSERQFDYKTLKAFF